MYFIFIARQLPKPCRRGGHRYQSRRTYIDDAPIIWVRDRALDHAVEKERDLKPMLNLKNLIKSEPSKSIPLSLIVQNRASLGIPTRPIDFLRKYPSIFQEYFPGNIEIHPHIKLTPEVLDLDVEEQLIYQSESHKQDVADRLLKLLMIGRINKIPLQIIDRLKWDLGLPQDFTKSIVPEFPDYFRVTNGIEPYLELVCWSNELAISVMEKKAMSVEKDYKKGMPLAFPLQYSRGFEIDKKFNKWVDNWQKLPYISPYENALQLQPKSDESDKWAASLLHEILNLLVPKKTERDNLLRLGEYFGLRSRFKRALLQHPGIFYISSKIQTHTVVLREAYKRDLLLGKHHPLMGLRSSYIHLMYPVKDEKKSKSVKGDGAGEEKTTTDSREGVGEEDGKLSGYSDSEFEDVSENDCDDDDDEEKEEEEGNKTEDNRGRTTRRTRFEGKRDSMTAERGGRTSRDNDHDDNNADEHEKTIIRGRQIRKIKSYEKFPQRSTLNSSGRTKFRDSRVDNYDANNEVRNDNSFRRGRTISKAKFDEKTPLRMGQRRGRKGGIREKSPPISLRTEKSGQSSTQRSQERSGVSRTRGRTKF